MKANIRKLAVIVFIGAVAMFIAVGMASAGQSHFGPIMGEYAVTGAGNNLVSTSGFDNDYNPKYTADNCPYPPPPNGFGCAVFQDIQIFSGKLTFNKDGTGHFEQINRGVDLPPLPPAYSLKTGNYDFIYTKTGPRTFTYQLKPGTYMEAKFLAGGQTGQAINFAVDGYCEGVLSQDLQNVIVTCGPPNLILTAADPSTGTKFPIQALFSQSIVGILVQK